MRKWTLIFYTLAENRPEENRAVLVNLGSGHYTIAWRFGEGHWDADEWERTLTDADIREWAYLPEMNRD